MYKEEIKYYKRSFFYALLGAAIIFIPLIIIDRGFFVFYGDYNAQQIPFYNLTADAIQNGEFFWSWKTDLGANFIGSYSFYTLGSPFFWLVSFIPPSITHFFMGPLLILKFALASLFSFTYIRRFTKSPDFALIGGMLYAFSGFSAYNVFFNHFHEAIVFFPLMLIALEEFVINKRRGIFALTIALNALANYFFFIGSAIFLVIYFFVRLLDPNFRLKISSFILLVFEAILGVMIAGILFVPSIVTVLDIPRSTEMLTGWDLVFHSSVQRYGLVLQSLFFPPDIAARQNFFPDTGAKWASFSVYLPLFSMAGVLAFLKGVKKHWLKVILPLCFLFLLIPGLNSMFMLFNTSYYGRWLYMPVLLCCLATAIALERSDLDFKYGLKWCGFAVFMISLVAFLPSLEKQEITLDDGTKSTTSVQVFGKLIKEAPAVYVSIAVAIGMIVACYILMKKRGKNPFNKNFITTATTFTTIACIISSGYTIIYGRLIGPAPGTYQDALYADFEIDDDSFYRIEGYDEMNNVNMVWDMYSLKSFHSIVPNSTFEMYDLLGFDRSVNSNPGENFLELRTLTSMKYLFINESKVETKDTKKYLESMKGYVEVDRQDGFVIYENQNFIPMGFAYDFYVTKDNITAASNGNKDDVLLKGVYLTDEQIEKYKHILSPVPIKDLSTISYEAYVDDAKALRENNVDSFEVTKNGFKATTSYEEEKLVMFSVPFDKGWTVKVNSFKGEIENINGGFIGIDLPAGENQLEFNYVSPGFYAGVSCSIAGVVIFIIYYLIWRFKRKNKPLSSAHLYSQDVLLKVKAHKSYIHQINNRIYQAKDLSDYVSKEEADAKINLNNLLDENHAYYENKRDSDGDSDNNSDNNSNSTSILDNWNRFLAEIENKDKTDTNNENEGDIDET